MKYLDFNKQEKGYEKFDLSKENVKANVGRQICYVDRRSIDPHRGYYNVDYGILHSTHYSRCMLNEGHDSIDMKNIIECGIQIKTDKKGKE